MPHGFQKRADGLGGGRHGNPMARFENNRKNPFEKEFGQRINLKTVSFSPFLKPLTHPYHQSQNYRDNCNSRDETENTSNPPKTPRRPFSDNNPKIYTRGKD
jgi:hypothetical protein